MSAICFLAHYLLLRSFQLCIKSLGRDFHAEQKHVGCVRGPVNGGLRGHCERQSDNYHMRRLLGDLDMIREALL